MEHWDFLHLPEGRPAWLQALDTKVMGGAYFLFGGKAYAVFALMFGISFFIALDALGLQGRRHRVVGDLAGMQGNLAQMAVWAGDFVLLYGWARDRRVLSLLVPYGRTSLTGYATQAVFGIPFFYGFGLGMYRQVGPAMALGFGLAVFVLQWMFARWWLARFAHGPLEWVWRAATLRTWRVPLRRRSLAMAG